MKRLAPAVPIGLFAATLMNLSCGAETGPGETMQVMQGRLLFERSWQVAAQSNGQGLARGHGQLSNGTSCIQCHPGRGRASSPLLNPNGMGLVVKVRKAGSNRPWVSLFQLGHGECSPPLRFKLSYRMLEGHYPDGTPYRLQQPSYQIVDTRARDLTSTLIVSPRLATEVMPTGALAGPLRGLRLQTASAEQFVTSAFADELGMPLVVTGFDGEPTLPPRCQAFDNAPDAAEISAVVAYLSALPALPVQLPATDALRILNKTGCLACHTKGQQVTAPRLFDMGSGLADQGGASDRASRMWRAPSLFTIAELKKLNPAIGFLHDGRALSVEEAILWHGGEAAAAQQLFMALEKTERDVLIGSIHGEKGRAR